MQCLFESSKKEAPPVHLGGPPGYWSLLIISEVISRSSPTLQLSHSWWLWKSNYPTRYPSCLFKLGNFFKYTFPCLFSTPEKWNAQTPGPELFILSPGSGSGGVGCCPPRARVLRPWHCRCRRHFLRRPSSSSRCWAPVRPRREQGRPCGWKEDIN